MKLTKLEELSKNKSAAPQLTEAKTEYSDSAEFTDEFYGVMQTVQSLKKIMRSPRWMRWMESTDLNFGTKAAAKAKDANFALGKLEASLIEIDDELESAN